MSISMQHRQGEEMTLHHWLDSKVTTTAARTNVIIHLHFKNAWGLLAANPKIPKWLFEPACCCTQIHTFSHSNYMSCSLTELIVSASAGIEDLTSPSCWKLADWTTR
jgi:hypothetical protein